MTGSETGGPSRRVHPAKRCGVVFGKGLRALAAAEALKAVSVFTEFLAAGIAVVTDHCGLPFCGSKPIIALWSALRLTPRADLALSVVNSYRPGLLLFIPHLAKQRHTFKRIGSCPQTLRHSRRAHYPLVLLAIYPVSCFNFGGL